MRVRDLITQLQQFDPDMQVVKSYDYGDHWNTTVCPDVDEPEEREIKYSDYHGMDMLVGRNDDDDWRHTEMVVVL